VSGLAASYGDTQILWNVSLEVQRGEVVSIVGANGAGKSTLLNVVSGLLPSWSGSVTLAGRDVTNTPAEKLAGLGLSQVPQGRRLFVGLTVEQNLRLGAYARRAGGPDAIHAELERVFALLPKLRERRTQLAGSLSGGEQQMVAIGRGLMSHPVILLVDELSLGLAPNVVDDLLAAIDTIHREEGLSFLLVEQDVQVALERADRGYVIENGHIVLAGTGAELLNSAAVREAYLGA
jgi:branched-chain amino acid transport system ATP-binding protein